MNFAVLMIENETQRIQEVNVFEEMDEVNAYLEETANQNELFTQDDVYSFKVKRLEDVELE